MHNSPGLGNTASDYNATTESNRNDCSLRVARAIGVSDGLNTAEAAQFLGNSVAANSDRLQVIVWYDTGKSLRHMGLTRNGNLYHMSSRGYNTGNLVNYQTRIIDKKYSGSANPSYYNIP
jgi:hypothetical protein